MKMVQAHIYYSGMVQGVGFRFAAQRLARTLNVCGWARNLSDGRVEIVAQGTIEQIQNFLSYVDDRFPEYIKTKTVDYQESGHKFEDFEIRITY